MISKMKVVDLEQFKSVFPNVTYGNKSKSEVMDIILPDGKPPYPVVVYVHGGGWFSGTKLVDYMAPIFKIISAGYAIAAVEYRLSTEAIWPAQIHDIKTALRFLRKNGGHYGLSTEKIAIWGNSAGAHLAQMAAAAPNCQELEDRSMGYAEESDHVDMLISWYGPSNLLTGHQQTLQLFGEEKVETQAIPKLLGGALDEKTELAASASPVNYVTSQFPKALFQHGTADVLVPYLQSKEITEKINALCGNSHALLEIFPGEVHGGPAIKADKNIVRCIRFLDNFFEIKRDYDAIALPEIQLKEV